MVRDLLVHVDGSAAGRRRVQLSLDLAERVGARLIGLHVTPPVEASPLYKPSRLDQVLADTSANLEAHAAAAAAIFDEETKRGALESRWVAGAGDIARVICGHARYADMVIVGQYEWQGSPEAHPLPVAHAVVLQCGRPVVVVPEAPDRWPLGKVAIAWDGSREAVRAVHDALPLLRLAQSVQIVTVVGATADASVSGADRLSEHLARHGVQLERDSLSIRFDQEHAALRCQIEQGGFDGLVMGGYSHPVWFEFVFGGATESVLLSSEIPVLVSH
jgi:nucleotide-binding universal stress UspA family protein